MDLGQLTEIADNFGNIATDDNFQSPLLLSGKKYNKQQSIYLPKTDLDFDKFKKELKDTYKYLNLSTENYDDISSYIPITPSPLQMHHNGNCIFDFGMLDNITKVDIADLLSTIEKKTNNKRFLDKPNYIGYYRPFHYYPKTWGVYMDLVEVHRQGKIIYEYNKLKNIIYDLSFFNCILISFYQTYYHEIYHHKFEMSATKIEIIQRKPFYTEGFNFYYCKTFMSDLCLEEAFANEFSLNKTIRLLKNKGGFNCTDIQLIKLIREAIFLNSPPGYRVAYELTSPQFIMKPFEDRFFELIYKFSHKRIYGTMPDPLNPLLWDLFTYKLDPLMSFEDNVNFVIAQP